MSIISLSKINKVYETKQTKTIGLREINLEIKSNEMVAIMGPSGCGKSTLLNIIGLIDKPTSGLYYHNEKDTSTLNDQEAAAIRNRKIGFIYQYFALIKEFNIIENIMLPLNVRKLTKKDKLEIAFQHLKEVGLEDVAKKYPNELSGGQQQRIAIARALGQDTDVILADEPTGNLDQDTGKDIMNLLVSINKKGKTIVIVTHDEKIVSYCNRKITMKDGGIVADEVLIELES
ncbi:ABC transporter ATP-binding protein [Clostridium sp. C8-1-8]|uniref:ABC transporter ATP-binding protein n=1 Tax=Clostridium sp. C8-1-8 TaxID=2698831 RepID=UPI00136D1BC1|nr:ABC transporter ATP-binding protein [Clostridium sp. C8-1-8]